MATKRPPDFGVASGTIEEWESRNPLLADIHLETGMRVGVSKAELGGVVDLVGQLGAGQRQTGPLHIQWFEPAAGESISEVLTEALALAESAGFEMRSGSAGDSFCGYWNGDPLGGARDVVKIRVIDRSDGFPEGPVISIELAGTYDMAFSYCDL